MKMKRVIIQYAVACGLSFALLFASPLAAGAGVRYTEECIGEIINLTVWNSGRVDIYLAGSGTNPAIIPDGGRPTSDMLDVLIAANLNHKPVRLLIGADRVFKCRDLFKNNTILSVQTVGW